MAFEIEFRVGGKTSNIFMPSAGEGHLVHLLLVGIWHGMDGSVD